MIVSEILSEPSATRASAESDNFPTACRELILSELLSEHIYSLLLHSYSVGNCWQQNHVNEIFVFSLVAGVASTGKGTNLKNLTFSKQIDKSSPLLMNAINNNENLFLEFWFYHINRYGQWEKYYYIQLRGG